MKKPKRKDNSEYMRWYRKKKKGEIKKVLSELKFLKTKYESRNIIKTH